MPTYDYRCRGCGHTFDELQSFSEPLLTTCPKCREDKLERLFGGGGAIIFKGTGFYETDYRRPDEAKAAGKGAKADGDAAPAAAETKTEPKGDAAPASPPPPPAPAASGGSGAGASPAK